MIRKICVFFCVALVLEIFVFNYKFFATMFNEEIVVSQSDYVLNDGLLKSDENGDIVTVLSKGEKSLEILNLNIEIDNIYLDIENVENTKLKTNYIISATDEANKLYYNLPARDIVYSVDKTKYITMNLLGKTEKLKIIFNTQNNQDFKINEIRLNVHYPMFFSVLRFAAVFFIILIGYLIRPKSLYYRYTMDLRNSINQRRIIYGFVLLNIIVLYCITSWNPILKDPPWLQYEQYSKLTESFIDGKAYLSYEPDEKLKNMDNPYDANYRNKLKKEEGLTALWDTAYYNGKYYVYFGVAPVITMYLPYKLITGEDFSIWAGVFICSAILVLASLGLISQIIKRYFKNVPFILYLVLSFIFICGCGIFEEVKAPTIYSFPIIMNMALVISGLYFWLSALGENDKSEKIFRKWKFNFKLAAGSLCMALMSGCRPQVLLVIFLAIPIFWNMVFKERKLFSKNSISVTLSFCLPFIIIGAAMMFYNYIRFDSIFDFGAAYNLTTNDMTKRGFKLARIPLGIFSYLFKPLNIDAEFPFIQLVNIKTNYMGITITESMNGGILFQCIILSVNFLIFRYIDKFKEKKLFYFIITSLIFGMALLIIDTQVAGILSRYIGDFAFLFMIPAIIIVLIMLENAKDKTNIISFVIVALVYSVIYNFLITVFGVPAVNMKNSNPTVYYDIAYLVQFWL